MTMSPWLHHALSFVKYALPLASGVEKVVDADMVKRFQNQLDVLTTITNDLTTPGLTVRDTMRSVTERERIVERQQAEGPALRALYTFLKEADPNEKWGGLHKVVTPDGNILWLCAEHRRQYEAKVAAI